MSESIIKQLEKISAYTPRQPYADVPPSALGGIRKEITSLNYDDFLRVLGYVKNSRLPPYFKEELEMEYNLRGTGNSKGNY